MNSKLLLVLFSLVVLLTISVHGNRLDLDHEDEDIQDDDYWTRFEPETRVNRLQALQDRLRRRLSFVVTPLRRRDILGKIQRVQIMLTTARNAVLRDGLGSRLGRDKRQATSDSPTVAPSTTTERPRVTRFRQLLARLLGEADHIASTGNDGRRQILLRQADFIRSQIDRLLRSRPFATVRPRLGRDKREATSEPPSTVAPSTTTETPSFIRRQIRVLRRLISRLQREASNVNAARRRLLFRQIDAIRSTIDRLMGRPTFTTLSYLL